MSYTCVKCGCEDVIPSAPCPTSVGCPTPSKCEETFSTTCLIYTGDDIKCGNVTVVHKNDPINTALAAIVNEVCNALNNASFTVTINTTGSGLSCSVTPTSNPLTFNWTIEQGTFNGHTITGLNTGSSIVLTPISGNTLRVGTLSSITNLLYMTHIRLEVTNGLGNKVTQYYNYTNTTLD